MSSHLSFNLYLCSKVIKKIPHFSFSLFVFWINFVSSPLALHSETNLRSLDLLTCSRKLSIIVFEPHFGSEGRIWLVLSKFCDDPKSIKNFQNNSSFDDNSVIMGSYSSKSQNIQYQLMYPPTALKHSHLWPKSQFEKKKFVSHIDFPPPVKL
jgi:hypothetical protein